MSEFVFDEKTMIRAYSIVTNRHEIKDKLAEKGLNNCILIDHKVLNDQDCQMLRETETKAFYFVMYLDSIDQYLEILRLRSEKLQGIKTIVYCNLTMMQYTSIEEYKDYYDVDYDEDIYGPEPPCPRISLERYLEIIGIVWEVFDRQMEWHGRILYTDYENRCGNCHSFLKETDIYCPQCGTKRGEGEFKPYSNTVNIYYGCPNLMKWTCSVCGETWTEISFEKERYCPKCGAFIEQIETLEKDPLGWP